MEILYARCAGLDVHKETVTVCVLIPGEGAEALKQIRQFKTTTNELRNLATWAVFRNTLSNVTIDLRDIPFPEFDGPYATRSPFIGGTRTEITGVVTQRLTKLGSADRAAYFRMDVKDERTAVVTPWAVYVEEDWQVPNLRPGGQGHSAGST